MKRTSALGLILAATLGCAIPAHAGASRFSFGFTVGRGGSYYHHPYTPFRPYYAFRPYSSAYFGYGSYRSPYPLGYSSYYYRPYYLVPPGRYLAPARVYRPYRTHRFYTVPGPARDRGYVDYAPRRYRRSW